MAIVFAYNVMVVRKSEISAKYPGGLAQLPFSMELRTDSKGEAKAELPSGFYDLFIASTGFVHHCEMLRVRDCRRC